MSSRLQPISGEKNLQNSYPQKFPKQICHPAAGKIGFQNFPPHPSSDLSERQQSNSNPSTLWGPINVQDPHRALTPKPHLHVGVNSLEARSMWNRVVMWSHCLFAVKLMWTSHIDSLSLLQICLATFQQSCLVYSLAFTCGLPFCRKVCSSSKVPAPLIDSHWILITLSKLHLFCFCSLSFSLWASSCYLDYWRLSVFC